jgi:hypothetical protein
VRELLLASITLWQTMLSVSWAIIGSFPPWLFWWSDNTCRSYPYCELCSLFQYFDLNCIYELMITLICWGHVVAMLIFLKKNVSEVQLLYFVRLCLASHIKVG